MQRLSVFLPAENDQPAVLSCCQQTLLQTLGQSAESAGYLPIADCLYLDTSAEPHVCMQAVHLDASHDNARLLPSECLQLTSTESVELVASLNELWNPDGIRVVVHSPTQWQLLGQDPAALDCLPASMLAYRSVADAMPRSADAAQWRQLLTEAQMLLHDHPVNQARQARGLRSINAVWCFGGARFEAQDVPASMRVFSNDAFTTGLAQRLGLDCLALSFDGFVDSLKGEQDDELAVVVDTTLEQAWLANDINAFVGLRDQLIEDLLVPLTELVSRTGLMSLSIDDCNGSRHTLQSSRGLIATLKRLFTK